MNIIENIYLYISKQFTIFDFKKKNFFYKGLNKNKKKYWLSFTFIMK